MRDASGIACPRCGHVNRPGELTCSACGALLGAGLTTLPLTEQDSTSPPRSASTSTPTSTGSITLEISGQKITVPVNDTISLGRIVGSEPDDSPCDVDLTPFGAASKGVSRKHLLIQRKNDLIYVSDLQSTNGTFLNGHRLLPDTSRMLRDGDELKLGMLTLRVRF